MVFLVLEDIAANNMTERRKVDRLGDVIGKAYFLALGRHVTHHVCRQRNNRNVIFVWFQVFVLPLPYVPCCLVAIYTYSYRDRQRLAEVTTTVKKLFLEPTFDRHKEVAENKRIVVVRVREYSVDALAAVRNDIGFKTNAHKVLSHDLLVDKVVWGITQRKQTY